MIESTPSPASPAHAVAANALPMIVTQSQDNVDNNSDGSIEDGDSSVDPRIDPVLRSSHLKHIQAFLEATQSRCSKLVTKFLRRKMKVKTRQAGDPPTIDVQLPTDDDCIDVAVDAAAAGRALMTLSANQSCNVVLDLPPAPTIDAAIQICSEFVWGLLTLRVVQEEVVADIFNLYKNRKRIVIAPTPTPTAIGKSHLIRLMGSIYKGIHLIFRY